jgi:asparagine synthase (glutamine-hydrolysing)
MLVKVDRASMRHSLEVRAPLLDHRLLELVWSMPLAWSVDGGEGKRLLRAVVARHVPAALVARPKMGFDPPVASWLRGPLRGWAEERLAPAQLRAAGLRPEPVQARWRGHLSGRADHHAALWIVLQYLQWRADPAWN